MLDVFFHLTFWNLLNLVRNGSTRLLIYLFFFKKNSILQKIKSLFLIKHLKCYLAYMSKFVSINVISSIYYTIPHIDNIFY